MPNFVDVWSLDGMADRIDLDGAIPYHPKVWGLIASQSLLATQPPEEWEFVHQRHDTSDGPMAVPVNSAIELTLTGKRTARVFYAGETPRVSTVYQHGSSGLWFIAATKNLMVSGGTYYFELTRKEVMAWMTGNGYKPPTLLSPPVSNSENTRNTINADPRTAKSKTTTFEESSAQKPERLSAGSRALAAALDLLAEGIPVSGNAACKRAGVCRKNVRKTHPKAWKAIKAMASPDRNPRRGVFDRRSGNVEAIHFDDDLD